MKKLFAILFIATFGFAVIYTHRSKARPRVQVPLGTPEAPELRNDPTKGLQIVSASCLRVYDPEKPRCTAQLQFAKTGGPWSGYVLLWTLTYDNGHTYTQKWTVEGRQPGGIFTDPTHFKNGQTLTIGDLHQFGRIKDGRQMNLLNVAVQVDMLVGGGSGGGGR